MARGNTIVLAVPPQGVFIEGIGTVNEVYYPGMIVQRNPAVALVGGVFTYKIYSRDADGDHPRGAFWVVRENQLLGGMITDTVGTGAVRLFLYSPKGGEDINLLLLNLAGTADDHPKDEILMVDSGTGKLIVTTGSPETEVAQLQETITDPVADTLAWCQWAY